MRSAVLGASPGEWTRLPRLLAVVLILLGATGAGLGASASAAPAPHAAPPIFSTTINSNFSIPDAAPGGTFYPGTYLRAQFEIGLASGRSYTTPVQVWVPGTAAQFPTNQGPVRLAHLAVNYTFVPGGPTESNATNLTTLITYAGSFNATGNATLSSQLVALMSNQPYGTLNVTVSWRWLVGLPDGSVEVGAWTRPVTIMPALYAALVSIGPTTLAPGSSVSVCLGGPIAGRTFSLHLETVNPYDDFIQVNSTAPASGGPLCWSAPIPPWVPPQGLLAHVWDYDAVTLLLYNVKIALVNASALPTTGPFAALLTPSGAATTVAGIGLLGLGIFEGVRIGRSRRAHPRSSDRAAEPPAGAR